MSVTHSDLDALDKLLEEATGGPWELQDGSSWRRIGTRYSGGNGNVLCPSTYSSTDNHPDLVAGRGEDVYANLRLIVAAVNTLPSLIAELRRRRDENAALQQSLAQVRIEAATISPSAERLARAAREADHV